MIHSQDQGNFDIKELNIFLLLFLGPLGPLIVAVYVSLSVTLLNLWHCKTRALKQISTVAQ